MADVGVSVSVSVSVNSDPVVGGKSNLRSNVVGGSAYGVLGIVPVRVLGHFNGKPKVGYLNRVVKGVGIGC